LTGETRSFRRGFVAFGLRRQVVALLILSCAGALVLGVGPARAESAAEPPPTQLWKEYPLEPLTGQAPRERVPIIQPAAANASSPDWMLGIGGLALVVLILADAVFLALLSRALRLGAA
jgi:hypothetical protein